MTKFVSKSKGLARTLAPAFALLTLTACQHQMSGGVDDIYMPQMHYERHPIEVAKGTVKLQVPTHSSKLSKHEEEAVRRFAQQAHETNASAIHVQRPAGGMVANAVAGRVAHLMETEGIAPHRIKHVSYKGGAHAPVMLSFSRKFAVTKECGDWSENLSETYSNQNYPNFGCAQQHNLAAQVANPSDFETPRTSTSASASRRAMVFEKYINGEDTNSQAAAQSQVRASGQN
ncbi:MAG: CpaD family pilus assembly protein [Anderseniella sp.]|nr:CpaD family pilus assembly protein [Anderseniella sp.]